MRGWASVLGVWVRVWRIRNERGVLVQRSECFEGSRGIFLWSELQFNRQLEICFGQMLQMFRQPGLWSSGVTQEGTGVQQLYTQRFNKAAWGWIYSHLYSLQMLVLVRQRQEWAALRPKKDSWPFVSIVCPWPNLRGQKSITFTGVMLSIVNWRNYFLMFLEFRRSHRITCTHFFLQLKTLKLCQSWVEPIVLVSWCDTIQQQLKLMPAKHSTLQFQQKLKIYRSTGKLVRLGAYLSSRC